MILESGIILTPPLNQVMIGWGLPKALHWMEVEALGATVMLVGWPWSMNFGDVPRAVGWRGSSVYLCCAFIFMWLTCQVCGY